MTAPELWLHNPQTGELGHLTLAPEETGGLRMEGELWLQPGAAVLGEHVHSALTETFAVVEGKVGYTLDGVVGVAGPDETLHIPVGARHDWWNAGEGRAHVRFALDSADPAVPMAGRFFASIEAGWGAGRRGQDERQGDPDAALAGLAGPRVPGRPAPEPPAGRGADRAVRAAGAAGPGAGPRRPRTSAARRPLPGADPRPGRGLA
jgi:quercetin dioxygenase-like cupin family protein